MNVSHVARMKFLKSDAADHRSLVLLLKLLCYCVFAPKGIYLGREKKDNSLRGNEPELSVKLLYTNEK